MLRVKGLSYLPPAECQSLFSFALLAEQKCPALSDDPDEELMSSSADLDEAVDSEHLVDHDGRERFRESELLVELLHGVIVFHQVGDKLDK